MIQIFLNIKAAYKNQKQIHKMRLILIITISLIQLNSLLIAQERYFSLTNDTLLKINTKFDFEDCVWTDLIENESYDLKDCINNMVDDFFNDNVYDSTKVNLDEKIIFNLNIDVSRGLVRYETDFYGNRVKLDKPRWTGQINYDFSLSDNNEDEVYNESTWNYIGLGEHKSIEHSLKLFKNAYHSKRYVHELLLKTLITQFNILEKKPQFIYSKLLRAKNDSIGYFDYDKGLSYDKIISKLTENYSRFYPIYLDTWLKNFANDIYDSIEILSLVDDTYLLKKEYLLKFYNKLNDSIYNNDFIWVQDKYCRPFFYKKYIIQNNPQFKSIVLSDDLHMEFEKYDYFIKTDYYSLFYLVLSRFELSDKEEKEELINNISSLEIGHNYQTNYGNGYQNSDFEIDKYSNTFNNNLLAVSCYMDIINSNQKVDIIFPVNDLTDEISDFRRDCLILYFITHGFYDRKFLDMDRLKRKYCAVDMFYTVIFDLAKAGGNISKNIINRKLSGFEACIDSGTAKEIIDKTNFMFKHNKIKVLQVIDEW